MVACRTIYLNVTLIGRSTDNMILDQLDSKCVQRITSDDVINPYECEGMCVCAVAPYLTGECFLLLVHHFESQPLFELKNNGDDETHTR